MVTREQFLGYEAVRRSGKTNMWDWQTVIVLAARKGVYLEKEDISEIFKNYRALAQEHDPKRSAELVAS